MDRDSYFTLKQVKDFLEDSDYYDSKVASNLKTALEKALKTTCHSQKIIKYKKYHNIFEGFRLNFETHDLE